MSWWRGPVALMPPGLLLFYVLTVDRLGFVLTAAAMVLTAAHGARARGCVWPSRWRSSRRCSCICVFSKLLRVPLPPGCFRCHGEARMSTIMEAFAPGAADRCADRHPAVVDLRAGGRLAAGPVGDHGDGAAGAGDLLSLADRGHRHHHLGLGDGDLLRRHSGRAAAHSRHARLGRLYRRGLCDDAQGPAGAGARHRTVVQRARRHRRHALADGAGAAAGRDGAELLDLRIFLAGIPRPDVRDAGGALLAGEGHRQHAARPARRLHRHRQSGRHAALHLRLDRSARRHRGDPGAGRRIRRVGGDARHADAGAAEAALPPLRQHPQGPDRADASNM